MVRKYTYAILPDPVSLVVTVEHGLGPDVITQLYGARGRTITAPIDTFEDRVEVHFKRPVHETLRLVIIG